MATPVESYATIDQLHGVGFVSAFFTGDLSFTTDQQQEFLNEGASLIDSIIVTNPRIILPLAQPYDPTLVRANLNIATWYMLSVRGYNPEEPSDASIKARYDESMKWLKMVGEQRAKLTRQPPAPQTQPTQPFMYSARSRGLRNWGGNIRGSGGS